MDFKTLFKISLIYILLIFSLYSCSFADDIDDEFVNVNAEITNNVNSGISNLSLPNDINSRAYVVIDRNSNTILCGKNELEKRKMASTTKILTATVILENCNLDETIEVSKKAAGTGGSRLGLKTGNKITVHDLLYGLMLRSGNDCAVALAEYAGGSIEGFAELMNKKANELGLKNSHFETPHGLDSNDHYTTAYELAILTNYALRNKTFSNIVGTKTYTITLNGNPMTINNTNELLGVFDGVYGVKTGFTNGANRCLVTACKRNDLDVICVVLGADTKKFRTSDSIKLLNFVFNNFEPVNLQEKIGSYFEDWKSKNKIFVNKGQVDFCSISAEPLDCAVVPLPKNSKDNLSCLITCNVSFEAPVMESTLIGTIELKLNDKTITTTNIYTNKSVTRKSLFNYFFTFFKNFPHYLEEGLSN